MEISVQKPIAITSILRYVGFHLLSYLIRMSFLCCGAHIFLFIGSQISDYFSYQCSTGCLICSTSNLKVKQIVIELPSFHTWLIKGVAKNT